MIATNTDPRSRLHDVDTDGMAVCGTDVERLATPAEIESKKTCFFCEAARRPEVTPDLQEIESTVTIRVAEALVEPLGAAVAAFHEALPQATTRRAGRGSTYLVPLPRSGAQAVIDHLRDRLERKRTGLPVERYRALRAVRMIQDDANL